MKSVILSENLGPVLLFYKDRNALEKLKNAIIDNYFDKNSYEFTNVKDKENSDYKFLKNHFDCDPLDFFGHYFNLINLEKEFEEATNKTFATYVDIQGIEIFNSILDRKYISNFEVFDLIFLDIRDRRLSDQLRDM